MPNDQSTTAKSGQIQVLNKSEGLSDITKKLIAGGFAGFVEGMINFWLYSTKTRYQDEKIPRDQRLTFNLRILYRGILPFLSAVVPSRATQFGATEVIRSAIKSTKDKKTLTQFEMLYSGFLGGACSGLIAGPNELIIARQTQTMGFASTLKRMVETQGYGVLTLGLGGTACRNGVFAAGTLGGVPIFKEAIAPHMKESYVGITAALMAGGIAAVVSQFAIKHNHEFHFIDLI